MKIFLTYFCRVRKLFKNKEHLYKEISNPSSYPSTSFSSSFYNSVSKLLISVTKEVEL